MENNWGRSVNNRTGAINVPDSNQLFPIPRGDNVGLPNLSSPSSSRATPASSPESFKPSRAPTRTSSPTAVTPWLLHAPDIQVIMPTQKDRIVGNVLTHEAVTTASVIGVRLQVIL